MYENYLRFTIPSDQGDCYSLIDKTSGSLKKTIEFNLIRI